MQGPPARAPALRPPSPWERGRRSGHELGNGLGANRSRLDFAWGRARVGRMLAGGREGGGCRGAQKKRQARWTGCQAGPPRFPPQHAQQRRVLGTPWSKPRRRWLGACRRPARSARVVEPSAGLVGMAVGIYRIRRKCLFAYHAGPAGEGAGATAFAPLRLHPGLLSRRPSGTRAFCAFGTCPFRRIHLRASSTGENLRYGKEVTASRNDRFLEADQVPGANLSTKSHSLSTQPIPRARWYSELCFRSALDRCKGLTLCQLIRR